MMLEISIITSQTNLITEVPRFANRLEGHWLFTMVDTIIHSWINSLQEKTHKPLKT